MRKILIVDDQPAQRKALRSMLESCFENIYDVSEAENGLVAFKYIEEHFDEVEVILLDLIMPVMDGYQLIEKIKSEPLYNSIPVIVTSQKEGDAEEKAFELGASDFLQKPYNITIARHRIQNVTARSTMQKLEHERQLLSSMKQLSMEARTDQMTGLMNRAEMERQIQKYFIEEGVKDAVFFMLDIDDFKNVNDIYGHDCGDEAIRQIGKILKSMFRGDDLICRMGGDEFSAFMPVKMENVQLRKRLEYMCEALKYEVDDKMFSCSIGACVAPEHGSDYNSLYHNADVALLTAKRLGKNRYEIFGESENLPSQILYRNMDWLLDETSDAIYISDINTYEVYYLNSVARSVTGKDIKDCLGQPCYEVIWGNTSPCEHCIHVEKLGRHYCEHEVHPADSDKSYIVKGKLIDWGNCEARIQYVQNNTKQAELTNKLREVTTKQKELLDLLKTMVNRMPGAVCLYRWDGKEMSVLQSSNRLTEIVGTNDELATKNTNTLSDQYVHPGDARAIKMAMHELLLHETPVDCVYRVMNTKTNQYIWLRSQMTGEMQPDGTMLVYALHTDMTELTMLKQQLRQQSIFENLLQNEFDSVALIDAQTGKSELLRGTSLVDVYKEQEIQQDTRRGLAYYLQKSCVGDVEKAIHDTSLETVTAQLDQNPEYVAHYQIKTPEGVQSRIATYRYLDEQRDQILLTIRTLQDER